MSFPAGTLTPQNLPVHPFFLPQWARFLRSDTILESHLTLCLRTRTPPARHSPPH